MKLCMVAPAPPPYGGIANWTNIVKSQIKQHGSEIEFSFINIAPSVSYIENQNTWEHIWVSGRELLAQGKQLRKEIQKNKPDVIHLTTSGNLSFVRDLLFMKIMKKNSIPCIYHLHFGRVSDIVKQKTMEWNLLRKTVSLASEVIAIDKKTLYCLKENFPETRSVFIPNPVVLSNFPKIDYNALKKEVLYVGWVIKEKGIEELIKAWNNVYPKFSDYHLRLIGPYNLEYRNYLYKNFNMDGVVMDGELAHKDVLEKIGGCTVFILPSYTEGFPNVILEAMALKRPIIATNVGAIPEILSQESGIIIEPRNIKQIEAALCDLLSEQAKRERIAQNAFTRVVSNYDIKTVFRQYLNVWKENYDE